MSWSTSTPLVPSDAAERAIDALVLPSHASDEQFLAAKTAAKALLGAMPLTGFVTVYLSGHVGDNTPSLQASVQFTREGSV